MVMDQCIIDKSTFYLCFIGSREPPDLAASAGSDLRTMNKMAPLIHQKQNARVYAMRRPKIAVIATIRDGPMPFPRSSKRVNAEKTVPRTSLSLTFIMIARTFGPVVAAQPPHRARKSAKTVGRCNADVTALCGELTSMMKGRGAKHEVVPIRRGKLSFFLL
mmetsp:Transcript_34496/g.51999  ORF Transcript_34496/g.51999 Transcript_34496/m.51999 type:complete len:162 (-) Transcript_34496:17-502(-)